MSYRLSLNRIKASLLFLLSVVLLSSCYVQHPKYASIKDVNALNTGMTITALTDSLKVQPHYTKSKSDSGVVVYVYKYRLCEVKRIPILMRKNKGLETEADFVDLLVTVNREGIVTHLESCTDCTLAKEKTRAIDFKGLASAATTIITVTLPSIIVLLSRN